MATKKDTDKGGKKKPTKTAAKPGASSKGDKVEKTGAGSKSAADAKTFALGAQRDGSVVLRIPRDFDLMVLRKAVEKQLKNAGAAVGTMSALADGDDPMIDAVSQSLGGLLKVINNARAPENQIADTPIGKEIARNAADAVSEGDDADDDVKWSDAIPQPRPKHGESVLLDDGETGTIVRALGFRGAGLRGDEGHAELQKLADAGKLSGAFEVVVEGAKPNQFVMWDQTPDRAVWRVVPAPTTPSE